MWSGRRRRTLEISRTDSPTIGRCHATRRDFIAPGVWPKQLRTPDNRVCCDVLPNWHRGGSTAASAEVGVAPTTTPVPQIAPQVPTCGVLALVVSIAIRRRLQ